MPNSPAELPDYWPLAVYFGAVLIIVTAMLLLSYFLGERHREKQTDEPYESGIASTGSARVRFDVKFYLIAMFFVIFDLEAVFIFAWAVSLRENGWPGFAEMLFFIGVLTATLVYLWRIGALEWGAFARTNSKTTTFHHEEHEENLLLKN
jgi:NADH-quinone oxidoreductase subunit A